MIATARARWITALAVCAAVVGILQWQPLLVQTGVATLVWVGLEWLAFRYRIDFYLRRARVRRVLKDRRGTASVLWVGRAVQVETRITLPAVLRWLPAYADVRDLLPAGAELIEESPTAGVLLGHGQQVTLTRRVRPTTSGSLRFPGVRLVLSDLHGLFQAERFLSMPSRYRVLPQPLSGGSTLSVRKRTNQLPPPGMHTVSRAGVGSELLEIRDYVPGDPPRSIAWKVSARRDALMSKQFESEVPVRCHLLVDMSRAVRLGYPGPCLAHRLVSVAATLAQTLAAHRDPVGLMLFGVRHVSITRPSTSRRAVLRMLDQLADAIDEPIAPVEMDPASLLPPALDLARACYPRQLQRAEAILGEFRVFPRGRRARMRLQMAAFLASRHALGPLALGELVQDDVALARHLQVFLAGHQVPYLAPVSDAWSEPLDKISQVAGLLTRAVAKGRDNELFVVMAGLLDVEYRLQPLVRAIKVAVARHHRVVVLCAWPPNLQPPGLEQADVLDRMATLPSDALPDAAHRQQQVTALRHLRRELGSLRVPVVAAADDLATRLVMRQMEIVRHGRIAT